jgi:two-component system NtrC family sensor kinase
MTDTLPDQYQTDILNGISCRQMVVSADRRIQAFTSSGMGAAGNFVGQYCYQVHFGREKPCIDCAVDMVIRDRRAHLRRTTTNPNHTPNLFVPIHDGDVVTAVAVIDLNQDLAEEMGLITESGNVFLRNLIMNSVDGIIASDMTGRILIFNEAAGEMVGYPHSEAVNNLNIRDIYPGDGARDVMRRLRSDDYGGKGKLINYRTELLRHDGTTFPIELSASIVYEGEQETATVGFFYDLREKLRMDQELKQAQVQLMQAEKMSSLGKLSAGVAHQLNNPIGGIVLYSQILMEEYDLPPDVKKDLQRILDDAERAQMIVRELLDFSRQSTLEIRPNDLNQAIARTIFLLENQPLFKHINIIKEFDPDLPKVPSDIQQLNHVFMNLILNAADAMEGKGTLRIKTALSPTGKRVLVTVADTGPGIPSDVLPHIFDPFYTTKEDGRGTGLGLSVAYGVIENHGGRITACSAPGEGATFQLDFLLDPQNGSTAGGDIGTVG